MKLLHLALIKIAVTATILCLSSKVARSESYTYQAQAKDESGKVVYTEKASVTAHQGHTQAIKTEYFSSDGKKVGEMNSKFKNHPYLSDFYFSDHRAPFFGGMKIDHSKKSAEIFSKGSTTAKFEKKSIDMQNEMMAFPGVQSFIADYVDQVEKTKKTDKATIRFVIPQRNDDYGFKVSVADEKNLNSKTIKLKLEAQSFFIRLFAPKIEIEFDKTKKRIVSYKGPSIVSNDKGKCQNVQITYQYKDVAEQPNQLAKSKADDPKML